MLLSLLGAQQVNLNISRFVLLLLPQHFHGSFLPLNFASKKFQSSRFCSRRFISPPRDYIPEASSLILKVSFCLMLSQLPLIDTLVICDAICAFGAWKCDLSRSSHFLSKALCIAMIHRMLIVVSNLMEDTSIDHRLHGRHSGLSRWTN